MINYMIVDDTECENFYFYDLIEAKKFFNTNNHTMTLFIKTLTGWKEIDYRRRS